MTSMKQIIAAARKAPKHIVLSEGEDPRIIEAACEASKDGIARITLLGDKDRIWSQVSAHARNGSSDTDDIQIIDPKSAPRLASYAEEYHVLRRHKGIDQDAALHAVSEPLGFAAMMVRQGDADGTVSGAVQTTSDTVRTALQVIGKAPEADMVSSFFLVILQEPHHQTKTTLIFADCALIIDPTAEELATIAISSAGSYRQLIGQEPLVAMLSFSTAGSASHAKVDKVNEATNLVRAAHPALKIHGDLQFDAAFVPEVSALKSPESDLEGRANVMIFPNIEAGNIGYKIAHRIGGAIAVGPILQGLAHPANDLSRGCSAQDIYNMIAVTCVQVQTQT